MKKINNYIIEKLRLGKTTNLLNMSDEERFKIQHNVEIEKEKQDNLFITKILMDCKWVNRRIKDFDSFIKSLKDDKLNTYETVSINRRYNGENSIDIHIYDDKKFVGQIIIWSDHITITLNFAPNDEIEHIIYTLLDDIIEKYSKKHYKS